jgi:hypothetical protein
MFFPVLRRLKFQKPISQQGEKSNKRKKNKIHADILELCMIIKMSHMNGA